MSSIKIVKAFLPMMGLAQAAEKINCDHPNGHRLREFNSACDGNGEKLSGDFFGSEQFTDSVLKEEHIEKFTSFALKEKHIQDPKFFVDHECKAHIRVVSSLSSHRIFLQVIEKCKKEAQNFTRGWKVVHDGKKFVYSGVDFEIKQMTKAFEITADERQTLASSATDPVLDEPTEVQQRQAELAAIITKQPLPDFDFDPLVYDKSNRREIMVQPQTIKVSNDQVMGFFEDRKSNSIGIGSHKVVRASETHKFSDKKSKIYQFEEIYKFNGKYIGSVKNLVHAVKNVKDEEVKVVLKKSNEFSCIKHLVNRIAGLKFSFEYNSLRGLKMKHADQKGLDFLKEGPAKKKAGWFGRPTFRRPALPPMPNFHISENIGRMRQSIGEWSSNAQNRIGRMFPTRTRRNDDADHRVPKVDHSQTSAKSGENEKSSTSGQQEIVTPEQVAADKRLHALERSYNELPSASI